MNMYTVTREVKPGAEFDTVSLRKSVNQTTSEPDIVDTVHSEDPFGGFGRQTIFEYPYLFVTEPFSGTGKVHVYQLKRFRRVYERLELLKTLVPERSNMEVPGFGSHIVFEHPRLFIGDTDRRGALFTFHIGSCELKKVYQHDPIGPDAVGKSFRVIVKEKKIKVLFTGCVLMDWRPCQHMVLLE